MFNLNDQAVRGGNFCLSKANLLVAGTDTGAQTAPENGTGIEFCIDGALHYMVDANNNVTFTTGEATLAAKYTNIYLVSINADDDILITAGTPVLTASLDAGLAALVWPALTDGYCPIGALLIDAGASEFVPLSTSLGGSTSTIHYMNLFSVPPEPITESAETKES